MQLDHEPVTVLAIIIGVFHGVARVPPLGLWNCHQPVKELKSAGKIFIKCPYDFASEVRYTVNVRKFELVKKMCNPCDFASDTPMSVVVVDWKIKLFNLIA